MKPDISVVIPLYNKEKYIRRAIDSVLGQTFQDFECIIIDSSNDGSSKLVSQYDDTRIVHIIRERTRAAAARNLGTRYTNTDFIAFLDADDEWLPDHLETLIHLRQKFPKAGVYSTPYVKLKPDGGPMVMLFAGIPHPPWEGYIPDYLLTCSRGDELVNSSTCAIPLHIFNSMGGFPEDLVYGEDQFLWGRISLKYPVAYSWNGLTIYHTEALGRICNEVHAIQEHPFSAYLRRELAAGRIPHEREPECRAYIQRKRYSEIFSGFLFGNAPVACARTNIQNIGPRDGAGGVKNSTNSPIKLIGKSLNRLYYSSVHDAMRRFLCNIYGCHDPGSDLDLIKRE